MQIQNNKGYSVGDISVNLGSAGTIVDRSEENHAENLYGSFMALSEIMGGTLVCKADVDRSKDGRSVKEGREKSPEHHNAYAVPEPKEPSDHPAYAVPEPKEPSCCAKYSVPERIDKN